MGTVISPSRPQAENISEHDEEPLYHVVLLDDSEHTYDYVIEMLTKLFCMSETQAFQHAVEVDTNGRTIVLTCDLPAAEYANGIRNARFLRNRFTILDLAAELGLA